MLVGIPRLHVQAFPSIEQGEEMLNDKDRTNIPRQTRDKPAKAEPQPFKVLFVSVKATRQDEHSRQGRQVFSLLRVLGRKGAVKWQRAKQPIRSDGRELF
jgi:hypothetical protein